MLKMLLHQFKMFQGWRGDAYHTSMGHRWWPRHIPLQQHEQLEKDRTWRDNFCFQAKQIVWNPWKLLILVVVLPQQVPMDMQHTCHETVACHQSLPSSALLRAASQEAICCDRCMASSEHKSLKHTFTIKITKTNKIQSLPRTESGLGMLQLGWMIGLQQRRGENRKKPMHWESLSIPLWL